MPNNTTNILVLIGSEEDVQDIRDLLGAEIDFNKVIPRPEELNIESGSNGDQAYSCLHTEDGWKKYLGYNWVQDAGIKNKVDLIVFLEKRAGDPEEGELSWRELGNRYASNLEKYGATTWYDWCCEYWGTKWSAYEPIDIEDEDENRIVITFHTAWSAPLPIYKKLAELFPDVDIEAYWSDEGCYEVSRVY